MPTLPTVEVIFKASRCKGAASGKPLSLPENPDARPDQSPKPTGDQGGCESALSEPHVLKVSALSFELWFARWLGLPPLCTNSPAVAESPTV